VLKKLLAAVAEIANEPEFLRGFDLCVSVLSTEFPISDLLPRLNNASVWDEI
jgi:hypothetical protein